MNKTILTITSFAALVVSAKAATVASDDFTYPDGNLAGQGGWTVHSGDGGTDVLVSSNAAVLVHGGGSREDVNLGFAAQTTGVFTAIFDLSVTDDNPITGTDFEYFAHFGDTGTFDFTARVDIQAPTGSGDYTVGIATFSSTAETTSTVDLDFGTVYSAELEFDFSTGLASFTIGGNTITSTTVGAGVQISNFNLRQSNSSSDETITVDNLVIDYVPEPSVALLGGLGLLGLLRRRR